MCDGGPDVTNVIISEHGKNILIEKGPFPLMPVTLCNLRHALLLVKIRYWVL